jgi:hypothetical protein
MKLPRRLPILENMVSETYYNKEWNTPGIPQRI